MIDPKQVAVIRCGGTCFKLAERVGGLLPEGWGVAVKSKRYGLHGKDTEKVPVCPDCARDIALRDPLRVCGSPPPSS